MRKLWILGVIVILVAGNLLVVGTNLRVSAAVSACTATVSPIGITTNSTNTFQFSIQNTDSVNYTWIKITRPSNGFTITGYGLSGSFSASSDDSSVTLINGSLSPGSTQDVNITAEVRNIALGNYTWTVQTSDDMGGASPFNCTGTLGTEITSGGSDTFAPEISSLSVSEVAQTSVKITWTTDENSNSVIQYGTTSSYGSTKTDSTQTTSHSVTIDGLSSNTTYHFKVQSTDGSGNTGESSDNTFATSQAATTTTVTTTTTTTVTKTVEKLIEDTEKPGITFTTDFDEIFSATPTISGKVTDNQGVSSVEYSMDGGANYLPVDELLNPKEKISNFKFQISNLLDGNYKIRVRATDLTGNVTVSGEEILVFDRLAPRVGGAVYTLGSQVLEPQEDGSLVTIAGLDQKVTLAAVGGPTEIQVIGTRQKALGNSDNKEIAVKKVLASESQLFSLTKNPDTGLWSGTVSIAEPGIYTLQTRAIDGAGNETIGELGEVLVLGKGKVELRGQSLEVSEILVYYLEPTTNQFTLWDAKAFGQENPTKTDNNGNYSLILPAGKYYLKVVSDKLQATSEIFSLDKTTPINTELNLEERKTINLGLFSLALPEIFQEPLKLKVSEVSEISKVSKEEKLVGQELPYFNLSAEDFSYDNFYFRGKPTVISFLSTWNPSASQQLKAMNELSKDLRINNFVIVPFESASKVEIYKKLGRYETLMLADPDGEVTQELDLGSFPSHFILDRKGFVVKHLVGLYSRDELVKGVLE